MARNGSVISRMDKVVNDFALRTRFFQEDMTPGRAKMFVMQHRLNTRQRNSVLKLRVATNCPDWDIRMNIIRASAQELIADHEHGGGKAHWEILEDLGVQIGLKRKDIRAATPLPTTQLAWSAWEGLMGNRHWLEGIVANTCAERVNVPGYGAGVMKKSGWMDMERKRWGKLFGLTNAQLGFFEVHEKADLEHSDMGWMAVERFARQLNMENEVVAACERNLRVWELYLNGIGAGGDALDRNN